MNFRLTPLNIVMAIALAVLVMVLFESTGKGIVSETFSVMAKALLGALVVICFIADLIFRFAIKDLKRIWFIEMAFIAIAFLFFLILQK
jgi:hypothetical protein